MEGRARYSLLSVRPMVKASDRTTAVVSDATELDAEIHMRQMEDRFSYYDVSVHNWSLCCIADNESVSFRIAKILEIPHVGCCSHKLSLEGNNMV